MRPLLRYRRPQPPPCWSPSPDCRGEINFQVKAKGDCAQRATSGRLILRAYTLSLVALFALYQTGDLRAQQPAEPAAPAIAEPAPVMPFPRFRAIDADAPHTSKVPLPTVRLLAETDFAPWSFTLEDGSLAGISVDLARAACTEAGLTCDVLPVPFTNLLPSLIKGDGDVIVSGLRLNHEIINGTALTRPYFRSMARFMIRRGTQIEGADPRSLAGRRVGVVTGTAHEAFLKKFYDKAQLVVQPSESAMYEALRTGALDVAFGDSLHMSFWMNSDGARKCCMNLGGAVLDSDSFSRPLVYVARKDKAAIRDRLDEALDQLEDKGTTGEIFRHYLPAPIW